MRIPGYPRTPKMSLYNFPRLQWFLQHHSSWKQSDLSNGGPSHPHPCKVSTTFASCVCATGLTLDLDINLDTTVSLWIWIKHWVFTHLVGKHGQLSTYVIPPWSLNVTDTDAYPYIYTYLKKTCHLLISWTVLWTCARYQLPCEIELGKTLCSFNPFIQHTVLSFLAICTASISKGIKTALHSGSLLRRSSLSLLRSFNIQGYWWYWSNWTESFSQTGYMKPQTTPSELPPFNKGGLMAKSSWLVGVPKTVSDIEESTLKSHTGTWLKAWRPQSFWTLAMNLWHKTWPQSP